MHSIYDNPLPPEWLEEPLGTLVETKRGCTWTKEQERDRPADGTIPVIRIPNIQSSLDLADLLHIDGLSADQRASSAVTKGWTLLVGSNGNPKRIGDSILMEEDREMVFASFLFVIRPKLNEAKVSEEFIACWLHAHRVHEFVSETSQMTTGLANISWSACRKLPVRFPKCKEEQIRPAIEPQWGYRISEEWRNETLSGCSVTQAFAEVSERITLDQCTTRINFAGDTRTTTHWILLQPSGTVSLRAQPFSERFS